jgi:hypothetical protein
MIWSITIASVLVAWAMLRIIGNERQNRLDGIQAEIHHAAAQKAAEETEIVHLVQ